MIFRKLVEDIKAINRNDPASRNIEFLVYPGLHAIVMHRFIHVLYHLKIPWENWSNQFPGQNAIFSRYSQLKIC